MRYKEREPRTFKTTLVLQKFTLGGPYAGGGLERRRTTPRLRLMVRGGETRLPVRGALRTARIGRRQTTLVRSRITLKLGVEPVDPSQHWSGAKHRHKISSSTTEQAFFPPRS